MQRVLNIQDCIKAAAIWFIVRQIAHRFGLSLRRLALPVALVGLIRTIYAMRAKPRRFAPDPEFPHLPIVGQISLIAEMLTKGAATVQVERGRTKNFTTDEVAVFGTPSDLLLMDPRDREYMLKTNWKNFVKNGPDGTGFQENFAEVMGGGIFAVVSCTLCFLA